MAIGFNDRYVATEGQTEFHTSRDYMVGTGTLFVYVNGILAFCGPDQNYVETDSRTVTFNYPMSEGDVVVLTTSIVNSNIEIISIQSNPSLLTKYGAENRLINNNRYTVEIRVAGKQLKWSFTSRYSPLYSTVQNIRSDLGGLADAFTNDQINFVIYQNSKEGFEIYSARSDYSSVNAIPTSLKNWVRYKTCIDLIFAVYETISGNAGKRMKIIGPMQVDRETKIPFVNDMLKKFQRAFEDADVKLREATRVAAFVKAGTSMAFPLASRGSSF